MTERRMTERRVRRALATAVATLAASALFAACGVLPGSAGGSPGPVVVMTWAPMDTKATNMPGMLAMAQVVEEYVNGQGGLNGRKLKVLTCNERNDAIAVTKCAQQADDAGAVAVIGSYSEAGSAFTSALEASGIPYLGGYGITQEEFQSLMSYPINGGLPALLAGSGRQLADLCTKVTLVRPDTATGDQFPIYLDTGLEVGGLDPSRDLPTPDDATDYTAAAADAVGDDESSSCVSAVLGEHTSTFFDSLRRTGDSQPKVRLSSVVGSVQQSTVDSTGGRLSPLEGTYLTDWYPPASDPKWDEMKSAVEKYAFGDNRIDVADPGAQTTWIAYQVFAEVVRAMDPDTAPTKENVQRALDHTTHLSTGGLTPDLGWTDEDMKSVPEHARMVNTEVSYQVIENGRIVSARPGFIDLTATLRTRLPSSS